MPKSLPGWIKKKLPPKEERKTVSDLVKNLEINTVCEEANCPNIGECFSNNTATFMILGNKCSRNCKFCAVTSEKPGEVNEKEPEKVAEAVKSLDLEYAVITSVTRDDLADGGMKQFIRTVKNINRASPNTSVEILTPDFQGNKSALEMLKSVDFDVFSHNVETVPSLYEEVRPEASYKRSLKVLRYIKSILPDIYTKSGLMAGLGETEKEVKEVLKDLKKAGVDFITLGQYLSPSSEHLQVKEFVPPEKFQEWKLVAKNMGFKEVASGPFVRSSFRAAEMVD